MATSKYLELATDFALGWTNLFPRFKLILVMMIIPLFLNSLQFWILDNLLHGTKKKTLKFVRSPYTGRKSTNPIQRKVTVRYVN